MTNEQAYAKAKSELEQIAENDKKLKSILKRIEEGKATFTDSHEYSVRYSEILGEVLADNVKGFDQFGQRESVVVDMLHDSYNVQNKVLSDTQRIIDVKKNINVSSQKAKFPWERVQQVAHSLEDPTVDLDVIERRARNAVTNVSISFEDDFMQENVAFRSDAGFVCYITRISDGGCCSWCSQMAGRYVYGEEPEDIFRRHDNCGCSVTYENGALRQDVWSKKTWQHNDIKLDYEPKKPDKKTMNDIVNYKPIRLK